MNKPVSLELSILELSKRLLYEFWYDYVKPKYDEKAKLCYMDSGSFIVCIKPDDIYKDIAEDFETRFGTSNCKLDGPLPYGKNKNVIGLMEDELGGKTVTKFIGLRAKTNSYLIDHGSEDRNAKFIGLRAKTNSYLIDHGSEDKNARGTKKCVIKRKLKFENYENYLEATQLDNKINYLEKNSFFCYKRKHKEFLKRNKLILQTQQRFKSERRRLL